MKRYLDPKNDLPFKRVFGEHPKLLISFLNALMPFEKGQYITSLEYLPTEQVPENPAKKNSIVDVRCKDNYNRQFIVEMQMYWSKSFSNRMVFNASKAYVRQLEKNENYDLLQTVYGLGILNDVFENKTQKYYHHFKTINCENNNEIVDGLEYVIIELPKFVPVNLTEKRMAVLWLRFLKEIEDEKYIIPAAELMENEYIRQAIELCEEGAFTEAERHAYDKYWDVVRVERTIIRDGIQKGIDEGRKEGIDIGRKEGIEKEKENTVIKSYKNGASLEFISSITDLSIEKITSILQRNKLM
ncbi:MAG: Rpn family recombination-promoting nuclease/putative transposase [Bacteroidales bacterium]|jgi:predicted transposase/invertase (TIGR01784 family)|nr:Rpn family recombination-promoting nuclease/putative transposase [Bacteroidales bacterium]